MNFYSFHIGDYASATRHLSWDEDMAYRRLMDAYYAREAPLPLDRKVVYRLVSAQSGKQKASIDSILGEFFIQTNEGFRHKRCDEEIAAATIKRKKAKDSADRRWGKADTPSEALPNTSEGNANAPANAMRTHSEGNAPTPNPITNREEERAASPKDDWAVLEQKLRVAAGWEREPHPNLSVVGPIVELIASGSSLELDILPVIKARASKARPTSWNYFIPGIQDAAKTRLGIRSAMPAIDEEKWKSRLATARKRGNWDAKWGSIPGQPGCLVPSNLLEPGDGTGWTIWDPNTPVDLTVPEFLRRTA